MSSLEPSQDTRRPAWTYHRARLRLPPPWLAWTVIGVIIIGFYLGHSGSWVQPILYDALAFASAGMVVLGIRLSRVRPAAPWWLLAAGIALMGAGDVIWDVLAAGGEVSDPSWADLAYLSGMMTISLAAVRLLVRRGAQLASLLDAFIVGTALAILLWALFFDIDLADPAVSLPELATVAAYPVLDIVTLSIVAVAFMSGRPIDLVTGLFTGAVLAFLIDDLAYAIVAVPNDGYVTGVLDVGWLLGYVLWGAAALALTSSRRQLVAGPRTTLSWAVLRPVVRLTAVATPLIVAIVRRAPDGHVDALAASVIGVLISVVVIIRLELSLRDKRALLSERERLEEAMQRQISEDPLTRLPNRRGLAAKLVVALAEQEHGAGLLVIDLDDFKSVNDALGHQAGDEFLCEVASRLRSCVRSSDLVARYGGDEFAVVITPCPSADMAIEMAKRLLEQLESPIVTERGRVVISASIGVSLSDLSGRSAENLLRDADLALYRAKAEGKHRWSLLDPETSAAALRSLAIAADLPHALEADEFELAFQPIVSLADGRIESVEALLRWNHPTLGTLLPAEFLPAAERSIHMPTIGRWVLEEACTAAAGWCRLGAGKIGVDVNISAAQLADDHFPDLVLKTLQQTGLSPRLLTLELLETSLETTPALVGSLKRLRSAGIQLAIDDFGTGYSSLSRVAELPVTELKLDRAVFAGASDKRMASAVARMGQTLGLRLVAEGVETSSELNLVHSLGYHAAQGYLMSKPVAATEVAKMLRSQAALRSVPQAPAHAGTASSLGDWQVSTIPEPNASPRPEAGASGAPDPGLAASPGS